jgi:hypothetical protein
MKHLQPLDIVDAIDGTITGAPAAHLRQCDSCQMQVRELSSALRALDTVNVPEPSPLFWEHLSARVRGAIAAEPATVPVTRWFRAAVLAPMAGLALLVMALVSVLTDRGSESTPLVVTQDVDGTLEGASFDAEPWEMMAALLADAEFADAAADVGLRSVAGAADEAVMQLTPSEQEELVKLLQAELDGSGG